MNAKKATKDSIGTKTSAKKTVAKKSAATKTVAKKTASKKSAVKKTTEKKAAVKESAARKTKTRKAGGERKPKAGDAEPILAKVAHAVESLEEKSKNPVIKSGLKLLGKLLPHPAEQSAEGRDKQEERLRRDS
jgi:hypothetical protein